jgi:hypothetical protein
MDSLQVDDSGGATDVEQILAHAAVAGTAALFATDVGEPMFDGNSFAETLTAYWRGRELSESMLELLVLSDADAY